MHSQGPIVTGQPVRLFGPNSYTTLLIILTLYKLSLHISTGY